LVFKIIRKYNSGSIEIFTSTEIEKNSMNHKLLVTVLISQKN
jgi:hypothetical protein